MTCTSTGSSLDFYPLRYSGVCCCPTSAEQIGKGGSKRSSWQCSTAVQQLVISCSTWACTTPVVCGTWEKHARAECTHVDESPGLCAELENISEQHSLRETDLRPLDTGCGQTSLRINCCFCRSLQVNRDTLTSTRSQRLGIVNRPPKGTNSSQKTDLKKTKTVSET